MQRSCNGSQLRNSLKLQKRAVLGAEWDKRPEVVSVDRQIKPDGNLIRPLRYAALSPRRREIPAGMPDVRYNRC